MPTSPSACTTTPPLATVTRQLLSRISCASPSTAVAACAPATQSPPLTAPPSRCWRLALFLEVVNSARCFCANAPLSLGWTGTSIGKWAVWLPPLTQLKICCPSVKRACRASTCQSSLVYLLPQSRSQPSPATRRHLFPSCRRRAARGGCGNDLHVASMREAASRSFSPCVPPSSGWFPDSSQTHPSRQAWAQLLASCHSLPPLNGITENAHRRRGLSRLLRFVELFANAPSSFLPLRRVQWLCQLANCWNFPTLSKAPVPRHVRHMIVTTKSLICKFHFHPQLHAPRHIQYVFQPAWSLSSLRSLVMLHPRADQPLGNFARSAVDIAKNHLVLHIFLCSMLFSCKS